MDASSISKQATKIIEHNGLSDQIEVMHCKGEDMNLPEQVDLIISEWMGTLLLVIQTYTTISIRIGCICV